MITTLGKRIANDHLALTELKSREDNSDAIEIFLSFLTATGLVT